MATSKVESLKAKEWRERMERYAVIGGQGVLPGRGRIGSKAETQRRIVKTVDGGKSLQDSQIKQLRVIVTASLLSVWQRVLQDAKQ